MKINSKTQFPHPLWSIERDDYINRLERELVSITKSVSKNSYMFSIQINEERLKELNPTIFELIQTGKAKYFCEILCPSVLYRNSIASSLGSFSIVIENDKLRGSVEFGCLIVADNDISDYDNNLFAEDYRGYNFQLQRGDLLAAFPPVQISIDMDSGRLPLKSFLKYQFVSSIDDIDIDLGGDLILINIPEKWRDTYTRKRDDKIYKYVFLSSFVYNALVSAVVKMRQDESIHTTWAVAIKNKLRYEFNYTQDKIENLSETDIATAILNHPFKHLFDELKQE